MIVAEGSLRQRRITTKQTNHFCTQLNTDIQPNIFQNPVLIFLNEQFKAHETFCSLLQKVNTAFLEEVVNLHKERQIQQRQKSCLSL